MAKLDSDAVYRNTPYAKNIVADAKAGKLVMNDGNTIKPTTLNIGLSKEIKIASLTATELSKLCGPGNNYKNTDFYFSVGTNPKHSTYKEYNLFGTNGIDKEGIKYDRTKSKETGDIAYPMGNRGGVAEGIYAAAIYLRFMSNSKNRAQTIREDQLQKFIFSAMTKNTGEETGEAPNLDTTIKDDVCLKYGLKVKDHSNLMDQRLWPHWKGEAVKIPGFKEIKGTKHNIIQAALNYVNNTTPGRVGQPNSVMDWAKMFYENGVYNIIKINAEGEVAQDETKIDIRVSANNHDDEEINDIMSISLKYGGVGQFGQMAGVSYDITADVFKQWFGIQKPKFNETQFNSLIVKNGNHKQDAANAMFEMWQAEKDNLTKQLRDNPDTFRHTFWRHISQGKKMVREEPGVELVDAYKQDSTIYKLDIIKKIDFSNMSLEADWEISKATGKTAGGGMSHAPFDLCKTTITGMIKDKREPIVVIRVKRGDSNSTGPYYRTIFEKQKGLGLLIEDAKRVWEGK